MRPSEVLRRAAAYLERHGVESPRRSAEILMEEVLSSDRAGLYARTEGLSSAEARAYGRALCQRCAGVPLQHLTGHQPFRGLDLAVRPGVFVPRPETEILVEVALDAIVDVARPVVVDVGTGTGAVALSIKKERPDAAVFATDLSPVAAALARSNAAGAGLDVSVLEGDLLFPLPAYLSGRVTLVVSNPPYVSPAEFAGLPADVLADPEPALDGGSGGIQVHERLARESPAWLRPGGFLVVEIGPRQAERVSALFDERFEEVRVLPDLAGRDRVAVGRMR